MQTPQIPALAGMSPLGLRLQNHHRLNAARLRPLNVHTPENRVTGCALCGPVHTEPRDDPRDRVICADCGQSFPNLYELDQHVC
jgi:hypothetical protein